ncbi:MAG: Ig-like domain-containing protein [Methanobrevibacter sp.]|uniref:Ig-like domain-containing protein n=1 Tax=Methanobrevibacter sp. TaxID=66852 RepID=UPI0025F3AD3E|nr:hypothetical protein [Methanobrevibacter sp.]MBQ6138912.1 Ig-like domain-containing protein [Methanobrevibacter sp.]
MKRKLFFASLLILVLVTLSCVSAADDIQANDIEAIDDVQSEDISISDDSSSEEVLTDGESGTGSLTDLKHDIESAENNQYVLKRDYAYDENKDGDYDPYIITSDNFVLDGDSHTLNGGDLKSIFCFSEGRNITLKNIKFEHASPMYIKNNPITLISCGFWYCSGWDYGGAINDDASSTIYGCDFHDNYVRARGGAIYSSSSTVVSNCYFERNSITDSSGRYKGGGAIYLDGASPLINNSRFVNNNVMHRENYANEYIYGGGAIFVSEEAKNARIINCPIFIYNEADWGGAIYARGYVTIDGCVFTNNKAAYGGAVNINDNGFINNSQFNVNEASERGGAIYGWDFTVINSEFNANSANLTGGAINTASGTVINSNFTGNHVSESGGAISSSGTLNIKDSTFIGNTNSSGVDPIYVPEYTTITLSNVDTGNEIIANAASYSINSGGTYKATVKGTDGNALAGENVTLVVGNKTIASGISDENGVVAIKLTANILKGVKAGTHDLHVRLTNLYQDKVVKLTVKKDAAAITAKTATFVINYAGKYSVTLKNSAGKLLSGQNVTFTLNGKSIGSAKTNSKGVATITLTAKVLKAAKYGTKNLVIKLDSPIYSSSKTVQVKINKEKTSIVAAKKAFKKALGVKKYTITLKNSKGKVIKNAKLSLKVKGKTFKATTNSKGKATFKITNLKKKGTFKASINFKTTPYYLKASKSVKLTIK